MSVSGIHFVYTRFSTAASASLSAVCRVETDVSLRKPPCHVCAVCCLSDGASRLGGVCENEKADSATPPLPPHDKDLHRQRPQKMCYNITNPMNNKKTNTNTRALCNDNVERVLYESDKGSLFIKRKGNDGSMMFVPFSKPTNVKNVKNVKNQNGGGLFGMCTGESCNVDKASKSRNWKTHEPRVISVKSY